MFKPRLKFILYFFILLSFSSALASEQYLYTRLSNKDWLISSASTIYQQSGQYMWIGTNKGIYRFDGYNFKHYSVNKNKSVLNGEITYKITADNKGAIWALTKNGVYKYNSDEDIFECLTNNPAIEGSFFSSCPISDGILLGGMNKLCFYNYQTSSIELFHSFGRGFQPGNITNICKLSAKEIVFNAKKEFVIFHKDSKNIARISTPYTISCIYVDHHNQIWVGSYENGLTCYNRNGKVLATYNVQSAKLSNNSVLCITHQDSLLWVGTDGGGINVINPHTQQNVSVLKHVIGEKNSFPSNAIKCLYNDQNNTIWASSVRDGIIGIRKSQIKSYVEAAQGSSWGLSNSSVLSLYQESDNQYIWIGTDGEGINRMNLDTRKFTHYPQTMGNKVVSIANFNKQKLLLSVYQKGLYLFNKETGTVAPFRYLQEEQDRLFRHNRISMNLYNESPNQLLLFSNHLYRLNTQNYQLTSLKMDSIKGYGNLFISGRYQNKLYFHDSCALYELAEGANKLSTLAIIPNGISINEASVDIQGNIWLATAKGITVYSIAQEDFQQISSQLIHSPSTIVTDQKGNIWIGEGDKLYGYLHGSTYFALFGESDGVIPNEYIKNSHFLTSQGDIVLGGSNGLLVIDNEFKLKDTDYPEVSLRELKIDGEEQAFNIQKENNVIDIPARSKTIEMEFTTIENDILRPKVYRYEIQGVKEYMYETYSSTLRVSSMTPGMYYVYVSCKARNGEWTAPQLVLSMNRKQLWYKTIWSKLIFILFLLALSGIIATLLYRRKKRMLDMRLKEKEALINEEKIGYLININHELRTPLTLISGPLKRIIEHTNPSSHSYEPLNKIYHQTERMKDLLNMVLDLRKMEVGQNSLHIEEVEVNTWISKIVSDFEDEQNPDAIKFKTEFTLQNPTANFDKKKCEIVLTNLLVNAIKHSAPNDTIVIKTEATPDNTLTVSVIDQGTGLGNVDVKELFARYYQGHHEKTGTGIGLAYAKLLVELHHGNIGASNNPQKGATFFFSIPLNLEIGNHVCKSKEYLNEFFNDKHQLHKPLNEQEISSYDTHEKSILVVDDNVELIEFIRESFNGKFKELLTANDGVEAIDLLKNHPVDIVISDIMMPNMNGYELCQQIKSEILFSHIPVLLLTARTDKSSRMAGYKMGADAYIAKPFDIDSLYMVINSILQNRENIKQKYMRLSAAPEPKTDTFSPTDERFMIHLNDIIIKNLGNNLLDIPFICQEIGMSRASLYNKLKAITGIGCNEYINKIRIEHAIELVKNTQMNFTEIADETGFTNSRYFSTCFKQHTGKTPTQYRKEAQKK